MKQDEKQAIIDYVYNFSFEGELWSSKTAIEMIPKFADGLIKILSELRKPSEDIKQTIEEAAEKYQEDVYSDVYEESSLSKQKLECILDFKAGAEFALNLSENSGQLNEDLVKKITDILLKNHHGAGFTIPDFEVTAFKIAALIPYSRSQENGAELLEALKKLCDIGRHYIVFPDDGLDNAICEAMLTIYNYEKQIK